MEYGAYAGDAAGDVESVVESTRACLSQRAMDRACSTTMNRPVRTRMRGGVGAGGANLPATRLCAPLFNSESFKHSEHLILDRRVKI